jgi:hypothetical protein
MSIERELARREREQIESTLTSLRDDHGFISSWRREGTRWYINDKPGRPGWGPYGMREIRGFLDGCRAMGANV